MNSGIAIIPARFGASRFPGKPLAKIAGKAMIEQVFRRCQEASCFAQILVATDDQRIEAEVRRFGGISILTSPQCQSGSDRVAEAASTLALSADAVICNIQGDEPAVHPEALRQLVVAFDDPSVEMATLVRPLDASERENPNIVKAVLDERSNALLFSRHDIPFEREALKTPIARWAHLGLYGYRAETLERIAKLPPHVLEQTESLEQLRALAHGVRIACRVTRHRSVAVDRAEDVALAEAALAAL